MRHEVSGTDRVTLTDRLEIPEQPAEPLIAGQPNNHRRKIIDGGNVSLNITKATLRIKQQLTAKDHSTQ